MSKRWSASFLVGVAVIATTLAFGDDRSQYYSGINPMSMDEFASLNSGVKTAINSLVAAYLSGQGDLDSRISGLQDGCNTYLDNIEAQGLIGSDAIAMYQGYMVVQTLHSLALSDSTGFHRTDGYDPDIQPAETISACLFRTCEGCGGSNVCFWRYLGICQPGEFGYCNASPGAWPCIFARHACCVLRNAPGTYC